jgi:outer membrane protein assembly factor BamB
MKSTLKRSFVLFVMISIVSGCRNQSIIEPSEDDRSIMVFGHNQHFYALNKGKGKVEWKLKSKGNAQEYPIILNGIAYGLGGDFYAMNVANGKIRWSVDGEKGLLPTTSSDDYLLGATLDSIDIFNTHDKTKNSMLIKGMMGGGNPIVQDGILYYGTNNSKFFAVDVTKRKEKWHFDTKGRVGSPPVIAGDIVVLNDYDQQHTRFFYGLDRKTGTKKWEFEIQDDSLALAVSEGVPYYETDDGRIHAIDINTGQEKWSTSTDIKSSFFPVTVEGIICFSSANDGYIYGFEPSSKEVKWKVKIVPSSQPAIIDNTLYVNSVDGLHSIDVTLGKENWVFHFKLDD